MLSDSATPSNLNASNFLTVEDNNVQSYFWHTQLESDPIHTRRARLSLMVKKLDAIKIYGIAESGKTGWISHLRPQHLLSSAYRGTNTRSTITSHLAIVSTSNLAAYIKSALVPPRRPDSSQELRIAETAPECHLHYV